MGKPHQARRAAERREQWRVGVDEAVRVLELTGDKQAAGAAASLACVAAGLAPLTRRQRDGVGDEAYVVLRSLGWQPDEPIRPRRRQPSWVSGEVS